MYMAKHCRPAQAAADQGCRLRDAKPLLPNIITARLPLISIQQPATIVVLFKEATNSRASYLKYVQNGCVVLILTPVLLMRCSKWQLQLLLLWATDRCHSQQRFPSSNPGFQSALTVVSRDHESGLLNSKSPNFSWWNFLHAVYDKLAKLREI